jgi:hypothetical protein
MRQTPMLRWEWAKMHAVVVACIVMVEFLMDDGATQLRKITVASRWSFQKG